MALYVFSCPSSPEHEAKEIWWSAIKEKCPPPACETCKSEMERDWHREARTHRPGNAFPYVTKNLNGKPIEVRSIEHERELCKQYGKVKRDDAAWIDERYEGYRVGKIKDPKTGERYPGEQIYKGGSGRGLPGSW